MGTETFRDIFGYTRGPIACLYRHFKVYTTFKLKRIFSKQKLQSSSTKWKYLISGFSAMLDSEQEETSCFFNNFAHGVVIPVSHTYRINNIARGC